MAEGDVVRLVRMSEELAASLFTRDSEGRRLTLAWGRPDADGFYTPTITVDRSDKLLTPGEFCGRLADWADAAGITTWRNVVANGGDQPLGSRLAVSKSDLLGRIVYGGERGPSMTPCPVHSAMFCPTCRRPRDAERAASYPTQFCGCAAQPEAERRGVWSGCHGPWPGWVSRGLLPDGSIGAARTYELADCDAQVRGWWEAGCRCSTHKGSACTTGWLPDKNCCL